MKKMQMLKGERLKKAVSAGLAAVCILSLAACGSKKEGGGEKAKEDNVLVMATNAEFPPYEYREGGEIVGIEVDLVKAIAKELGMEFKIEDMAFDSVIAAVTSGKADLGASGVTVTPERKKNVNFTDTYAHVSQSIIVKEDSELQEPEELEGKNIGVQLGTTGDLYASDVKDSKVERYNKGFEAVQALTQGKLDAVVIDQEPAKAFVKEAEGVKILDKAFTEEDYAMVIAKENTELLKKINDILDDFKKSGKLDEITAKYMDGEGK